MSSSGLGTFAAKTAIVAVIFSTTTVITAFFVRDIIADTVTGAGGPAFWARVEKGLDRFANQPDLPPEKKARIIASLRKVNEKSRPYVDALLAKE